MVVTSCLETLTTEAKVVALSLQGVMSFAVFLGQAPTYPHSVSCKRLEYSYRWEAGGRTAEWRVHLHLERGPRDYSLIIQKLGAVSVIL